MGKEEEERNGKQQRRTVVQIKDSEHGYSTRVCCKESYLHRREFCKNKSNLILRISSVFYSKSIKTMFSSSNDAPL